MTNFTDILNKPAASVERPKPLPVGTYLGIVQGLPKFENVGKDQTPCADFTIRLVRASEDVDTDDLTAAGGISDKTQVRARYFLTDAAMWRLKEFLVRDLDIDEGTRSIGELINEAANRQVYVALKHRPSQDGQTIYHEIATTAKV